MKYLTLRRGSSHRWPALPGALSKSTLGVLLALVFSLVAIAAENGKRNFDLPAGMARETLRQFAAQADREIVFAPETVGAVKTNAVKGEFTPRDTIDRMLEGTGLVASQDAKTGAIAVRKGVVSPNAQQAALPPASDRPRGNEAGSTSRDELIELSPFVVSEVSDTGWVATETLAGTRLRTNFKDVPNQIETLTMDFMNDMGVTTVEQALIYTSNVENQNDYMAATPGDTVASPSLGGRIRGIGSGTLSRNYFEVHNPTDNFNMERVTIASGPNAILFGLGSPAGILDATPARAQMRNKYGFTLQYDSENSKRGTFDANVAVVPDKLAVRLMGMSKREYTNTRPNLDRDDRIYAAVTFTPFRNTTIILQGERDHRNWNRAPRIVPTESVTPWLYANEIPGSGYTVAKPVYNNSSFAGIGNNRIFSQAGEQPVMIQGGSVPLRGWRNSVVVRSPSTLPGVSTFDAFNYTLLDPSIFPFDVNIVGESRAVQMGGYMKTAIIEQKLAPNLFLELAYNREDAFEHRLNAGGEAGSSDFRILADANQFIPGTTTPNPNVGKLYFQGGAFSSLEFYERDDWRVTLSYELDLARKYAERGRWGKWLGRHRISGLYTGSKEEVIEGNFDLKILDDPVIPGVTLRPKTFQNWALHATRIPQVRHYFTNPYDPMRAAGPMHGNWTMTDANGQPFTLYKYDTPLTAADGSRLGARQAAQGGQNKVNALIAVWQGFFLPDREKRDRLVLTYGYRKDVAKSADLDDASRLQDFSGLFPVLWDTAFEDFGPSQSGINRNVGVVVRPLKWLSVFYNESSTFNLNIGRFDPFGNDIPGASGEGKDYGFRVDLWDDKLTLRLNRYENSAGPQRAPNQINQLRPIFATIDERYRELDPTGPTINITDGNKRGWRVAGTSNYNVSSDSVSEGYELEINLRPVPNWNIRLNGATSDSIESNIGLPWFEWAAQRLPVWESLVAKNGEVDASGRPVTWQTAPLSATAPTGETLAQAYQSQLVGRSLAIMKAIDGRATSTARQARANLITNYGFTGERLKGLSIGGAARWRAAPNIGYGVSENEAGVTLFDLAKAYEGEPELYFDAMLGYRGKMKAFGGFSYRLQLNVRNVLNEDDVVPVVALTTGAIAKIATVEPRVFVVTFGVDF